MLFCLHSLIGAEWLHCSSISVPILVAAYVCTADSADGVLRARLIRCIFIVSTFVAFCEAKQQIHLVAIYTSDLWARVSYVVVLAFVVCVCVCVIFTGTAHGIGNGWCSQCLYDGHAKRRRAKEKSLNAIVNQMHMLVASNCHSSREMESIASSHKQDAFMPYKTSSLHFNWKCDCVAGAHERAHAHTYTRNYSHQISTDCMSSVSANQIFSQQLYAMAAI